MLVTWFVAIKGKKQGPYSNEQLRQLAASGQLQPADMVMQEGTAKWSPASAVPGLFAPAAAARPAAPAGETQWYYAQNKQRIGPIPFSQLQGLALMGNLAPTDMVMQVGTQGWKPASTVPHLYDAPPAAPRAAAPRAGSGALGKVGGAARAFFGATKDIAVAASQEAARRAKLAGLRKDIDRLSEERDKKLPREVGTQLLNNNVRIPGCEQLAVMFQKLNKDFNIANQAALTGDKDKKKEAAKIAGDIEPILLSYGRAALDAPVAFENRNQFLERRRQLDTELAQKKAQLQKLEQEWKATSKGKKGKVMAAFGVAAAVLLLVGGTTIWFVGSKLLGGGGPVAAGPTLSTQKRELRELFALLCPSVPQVEAIGEGHGSGFLVETDGKLLVITNRHVVEDASEGVAVHFFIKGGTSGAGGDEKRTVPASQTQVIAIHKQTDLAVIDVTKAATDIRTNWKIAPVPLAPRDHVPQVGEPVFAIGHPAGGEQVLTRTLSNGIISAVGRKMEGSPGKFTQITVPINPGNSGGPLFDDHGRVIGINTFIIRGNEQGVTLEGLNFALEVSFVHELLADSKQSLDAREIASIMGAVRPNSPDNPLAGRARAMIKQWTDNGYKFYGGSAEKSQKVRRVGAEDARALTFTLSQNKEYAVALVSQRNEELGLLVVNDKREILQAVTGTNPSLTYQPDSAGEYAIVVVNPSNSPILVQLAVFEK